MIIGIVGKPSVGKSTFFKAATLADVDIANYPFTTIKPNHAVGFVKIKDAAKDFGKVANPRMGYVKNDWRFVPVDLMDVAGLVPDAHKGEGMGAQFLNDLNQADALIHVIDVSGSVNEKGESVDPGSYDPAKDIKFLEVELDYWYVDILKRGWDKFVRIIQQEKKDIAKAIFKQMSGLGVTEELAKSALKEINIDTKPLRDWSDEDQLKFAGLLRKKTKPMLIAANKCDHPIGVKNYERLRADFPDYVIVPCSAESELALKEADKHELIDYVPGDLDFKITEKGNSVLNDTQKAALTFVRDNILSKFVEGTGVQSVLNNVVFNILKRKAIHPGGVGKLEDSDGNTLPDCFLMKGDATAIDFAFQLHTDFGKNFIRAIDVRTKLPIGKDHVLKHLDIVEIMAGK
ncbi:redox-regulated ATPase YchF [Candidatus Woesearchaeota archaeon]|nr:redox-regulated ATPase YchF [Candidatus Woesearchaeota archaeon]MCF7900658.1 redox-regulated ATPase YchF [Candidatus Woesearchaeota archaeon]MCF8013507.1 redox-regulated ATPase YchF [Candidatus Woesearchaeota archaeon]